MRIYGEEKAGIRNNMIEFNTFYFLFFHLKSIFIFRRRHHRRRRCQRRRRCHRRCWSNACSFALHFSSTHPAT